MKRKFRPTKSHTDDVLLEEVRCLTEVPVVVAVNKSDLLGMDGYLNMSTGTGEGLDLVLESLLSYQEPPSTGQPVRMQSENQ